MFCSEWLSHMVAKASSLSFIILLNIQRNNNNRRSIQGELGMRLAERAMRGHVSASSAQLHWCKKGKGSDVTFKLKAVNIFVEFPPAPKITMAKHWTTQQVLINSVSRLRASGRQVPLTSAPAGRWGGREDRPRDENHEKKDHKAVRVPLHPRHPHVCWRSLTGCCGQSELRSAQVCHHRSETGRQEAATPRHSAAGGSMTGRQVEVCVQAVGVGLDAVWSGWTTSLSRWLSGLVQLTGLDL